MTYPPGSPPPGPQGPTPPTGPPGPPPGPQGPTPPTVPPVPPGPPVPTGPTDPTRQAPIAPPQGFAPPAASHQAAPPAPSRRTARILGRALLVLVVVAALGATTAWGFANRSSAQEWKERSERADAALREGLDEVESTRAEVEDARQRLRDLAAEKADETDRNRILSEIVSQAPVVTDAMRLCQQETTDLANEIISSFGDPEAVPAIQARIEEVNDICAEALDAANALEASIDELGL
jgi:hypothetical protein